MIYIIVPTYGRVESTNEFVKSMELAIYEKYLVVLIDNHPQRATFNRFKTETYIECIIPEAEEWWVGSINYGMDHIMNTYKIQNSDIVIFANNDITISPQSMAVLFSEYKGDNSQILHPRTFNQNGIEVSSGAKIASLFPYITIHPKDFPQNKYKIEMGTARFMLMSAKTMMSVGKINEKLVQYLGDNDFTLRAKYKNSINTYIMRDAYCILDDSSTGLKSDNISTINELYTSFFTIKSPNNIKYRYILFRGHYNFILALLITISMTFNVLVKYLLVRIKLL